MKVFLLHIAFDEIIYPALGFLSAQAMVFSFAYIVLKARGKAASNPSLQSPEARPVTG